MHLVVAPAGFGKSHLFRSLYAQLYNDFIAAKSEERRALRPLTRASDMARAIEDVN